MSLCCHYQLLTLQGLIMNIHLFFIYFVKIALIERYFYSTVFSLITLEHESQMETLHLNILTKNWN